MFLCPLKVSSVSIQTGEGKVRRWREGALLLLLFPVLHPPLPHRHAPPTQHRPAKTPRTATSRGGEEAGRHLPATSHLPRGGALKSVRRLRDPPPRPPTRAAGCLRSRMDRKRHRRRPPPPPPPSHTGRSQISAAHRPAGSAAAPTSPAAGAASCPAVRLLNSIRRRGVSAPC